MHVLLIALLAACGGSSPPAEPLPEGWQDPGISTTGATPALQLYRLTGRYELPESSVPPDHDPGRRFTIVMKPEKKKRFKGTLPFDVGTDGRRFAPPGMRVFLDGEKIPYGVGKPSWDIQGDKLIVEASKPPGEVQVAWEGVESNVARHQFGQAGLSAEDFVRYTMTLDDHTRDGMLLPAPGVAEWDVTLPASGATFETFVALEPSAIASDRSGGAVATLTVIDAGEETEVGRYGLRSASSAFERWELDLSPWKGKDVTLRLTSDPGGDSWHDYVFFGSPTVWGPPAGEVRRVVVIGLDTTRPDHMGFYGYERDTTPEFDRILGQSAVFMNAYTPAPRTRPSFRSATTGRYPLAAVGAKNIGEVFQENGFATAAYVANVHLQPRFDFHQGFDSWLYDGKSDAAEQVSRALKWHEENRERDTYMFLHIMDPHVFYNAPGAFRDRFVEERDPELPKVFNRWQVYNMAKAGQLDARRKEHIRALYDGEMAYTSVHLARFFEGLDQLGGNTVVVVHSDHGEEFWEHGGYEHNHTLYGETTDAVFAIRSGRGMAQGMKLDTPVTLADIAPTLYDFAGFADLPETDGKSLRPLVEGRSGEGFERPIGIAHLRYGHEQWGVVWNAHKYILHTGTGQQELYDLRADPDEQQDIAKTADLAPFREALSAAHDMPVALGWRIFVDAAPNSEPFVFELPAVPQQAALIDPERTVENPNNQSWGEPPSRVPAEIGPAVLTDQTLTWTPGTKPRDGLLVVLWGSEVDPAGVKISRGGAELAVVKQANGSVVYRSGRDRVEIVPGTVLVPPAGESERIAELHGGAEVSEDQMTLLKAMGYVGGDDEKGTGSEGDDGHGH